MLTPADLEAIETALEWSLIEDDGPETCGMAKALAKVRNALGRSPRSSAATVGTWAADARRIHADAEITPSSTERLQPWD